MPRNPRHITTCERAPKKLFFRARWISKTEGWYCLEVWERVLKTWVTPIVFMLQYGLQHPTFQSWAMQSGSDLMLAFSAACAGGTGILVSWAGIHSKHSSYSDQLRHSWNTGGPECWTKGVKMGDSSFSNHRGWGGAEAKKKFGRIA